MIKFKAVFLGKFFDAGIAFTLGMVFFCHIFQSKLITLKQLLYLLCEFFEVGSGGRAWRPRKGVSRRIFNFECRCLDLAAFISAPAMKPFVFGRIWEPEASTFSTLTLKSVATLKAPCNERRSL
ncbi:MAG: hypothetical protein NZM25_10605 [Leptospiraceae bacterium]|nr:hypothetical protein [Leptospiraceae bacterium]MDW8305878.1 hypothetical protein [Leptospiraceae bacterium]